MAQPSAGTSLPSTSLTSGMIFARNEADTTDSTQVAGALTYGLSSLCVMSWGTDADGRYKNKVSGGVETWAGASFGSEKTLMCVAKYASSGGTQALIDHDINPPRHWQFAIDSSAVPFFIVFDAGGGVVGTATGPALSSTNAQTVIGRIRNDAGTYRARVDTNGVAGTEIALSGTPSTGTTTTFGTGDRLGGSQSATALKVYEEVIWDRALTDGEMTTVGADGYAIFASGAATATTLSGPSSGTTGVASTNFTVGANGTITGTVTVTPGDAANGGTFTPTSVAISSGTPTATFTYTPASTGVKTISISDDGGLTDATSVSYTSNAAASTYAPHIYTPRSGMGVNFYGAR